MVGIFLYLHPVINYNIYIMYLLMQKGSKPRCYIPPPPWNNTVLGVPILRNTYTIYTSKSSKILQIYPAFNYLLWTFRTKPLGFYKILLLVLSFRLIPKSRNFLAATLLMFPYWVVLATMMSSAFPTFYWLLHLYLLNFLWVFMLGTFLNGPIGRIPHHWSTFLPLTGCS